MNNTKLERIKRNFLSNNFIIPKRKKRNACSTFCQNFWEYYTYTLFQTLFNAESLFYIMALGFTYLGYQYHDFFYSFMLIEVIIRVTLLKNVINAIYQPRYQIFVTLILFFLFIYYFSLFAITFLDDQFPNAHDKFNLIGTILRMLDQTFKV